ncbi:predicted protein [Histoplasma mississippiense (nom. inval.)]|uniref:predicted protein n=1 Tax=Ajellomyces capsulatus (strain NAm1 / WU24) TaxID=2059318 RepID=UPI000157B2A4|nr:predicted protein [Histoplasma mississippiense (nom. inval.)]EDN02269.1 predicted protein [Histoplasma mississippiense (nom. inval.)]
MPLRARFKRLWGKHRPRTSKNATTTVNANPTSESLFPKLGPDDSAIFVAASTRVLTSSESLKETRSLDPGPTLETVHTQNDTPRSSQDLKLSSLWDEAYDELRKENAKLVDAYEQDLFSIQNLGQQAPKGEDREIQLQKLLNSKLQNIENSQMKISIHGKDVVIRDQARKVVHSILSVKDYIGSIAFAEPHAALAWAGILIILPVITNPITQAEYGTEGLEYISELLVRCKVTEDTYRENLACVLATSSPSIPAYLVELNVSFRAKTISIYSQILKYQISLSQQCSRSGLFCFLRDYVIADDWQGMLESIKGTEEDISRVLDSFDSRTLRKIDEQVSVLRSNADKSLGLLLETKAGVEVQLLGKLYRAESLEGTRIDILREIQHWGDGHREECMFWIKGLAGTGKSTLARTIAHHFNEKGRLGASFFFSRGKKDLGDATAILTTIAVQLAEALPDSKNDICDVIEKHGDIGQQPLYNQWRQLIFQPLLRLDRKLLLPIVLVFVLDALDECEGDEHLGEILRLLTELKSLKIMQVKVLLTSRPERSIYASFRELPDIVHHDLTLHSVPKVVIDGDISIFLRYELGKIQNKRRIDTSWPGDESIQTLVQRADRLFIYAATVCRFIGESRFPEKRMSEILQTESMSRSSTSELDKMYSEILKHVLDEGSDEDKEDMAGLYKQIVGSIIVLFEALPKSALTSTLELPSTDITEILEALHSVLDIPDDENMPIQLFHLSFRDFLFSEERCANPTFTIKEEAAHGGLWKHTFLKISSMPGARNAAAIEDIFFSPDGDFLISSGGNLINAWDTTTGAFRYAIPDISQSKFALKRQEVLSPDGQFLACTSNFDDKIRLWDLKRVAIHSTLEGHVDSVSSIAFSPDGEYIVSASLDKSIRLWEVKKGRSKILFGGKSDLLLEKTQSLSFETPTNGTMFSPNGEFIAGYIHGLGHDQVQLWDAKTNCLVGALPHPRFILTLAFSYDGKFIASACSDGTVRIWDPRTATLCGILTQVKSGYADCISPFAFSPDGQSIACISHGAVEIWDLKSLSLCGTIENDTEAITCITFSPDSRLLAAASGRFLKFWDRQTKSLRGMLAGHTSKITTLKFSPNGQFVASGSLDNSVRLWDTMGLGIPSRIIQTHISKIKFTGSGHYVVSYLSDETTELRDPSTGVPMFTIPDFLQFSDKVDFSPVNNLLAYTDDDTVNLWNMATRKFYGSLTITDRVVKDGNDLAVSYQNHAIVICDLTIKKRRYVLKGHADDVYKLEYSSDGHLLVSASRDDSLRLWDPATGELIGLLGRRKGRIWDMAVSSDAKAIICISGHFVTFWDTTTKLIKMELDLKDKQVGDGVGSPIPLPSLFEYLDMLPLSAFDWKEDNLVIRADPLCVKKPWVAYQLQAVLWLPGGYRPIRGNSTSIHGNTIALTGQSNSLMLIKLDLKSIPSKY